MSPGTYTASYAGMWTWIVAGSGELIYTAAPIRNYLQNNTQNNATKAQAQRAQAAWAALSRAITTRLGGPPGPTFTIGEDTYIQLSLQRVYWGKGAPSEIQDALWLATLLGVVNEGDLNRYCRESLGVDCGGFVANYWGFGKPTVTDKKPTGHAAS